MNREDQELLTPNERKATGTTHWLVGLIVVACIACVAGFAVGALAFIPEYKSSTPTGCTGSTCPTPSPVPSNLPCSCTNTTAQFNKLASLILGNVPITIPTAPTLPEPDCSCVRGKVAIVTGASRGIGRAIATRLVNLGMIVYGTWRNITPIASPVVGVTYLVLEYNDQSSMQAVVNKVVAERGKIDLLVNNGAIIAKATWNTINDTMYRYVAGSIYDGHVYMTRLVMPHMPTSGYARVVEAASLSVYLPSYPLISYVASKAAVLNYVTELATDLTIRGSNIRISAMLPFFVNTSSVTPFWPYQLVLPPAVGDPDYAKFISATTQFATLEYFGSTTDYVAHAYQQVICSSQPGTEYLVRPPPNTPAFPGGPDVNTFVDQLYRVRVLQGTQAFIQIIESML